MKEMDHLLAKKDTKFKITFENIPDYVIILEEDENKDLIVSEVSSSFLAEFKLRQEDVIGKKYHYLPIFSFGYEDNYMNTLKKLFTIYSEVASFNVMRKTLKGYKYYSERAFTIKNGKNRVVVIGRDDRFRHLLDNVTELVFQLTPDLDIQFVSSGIRDLLGYNYKDVVGNNLKQYTYPDVAVAIEKSALKKSVIKDMTFGFRIMPLFKADGTEGMFSVYTKLEYNDDGIFVGILGSIREVTKEKLDEIRKSQQMETMLLSFSHSLDHIDKKLKTVKKEIGK
jgi:PAS domain S-box-containing protein